MCECVIKMAELTCMFNQAVHMRSTVYKLDFRKCNLVVRFTNSK